MEKWEKLIIIGAGASGLMAGIMAGRQGCSCLFLEHEGIAGKKLLATGNGRCNFTNENQEIINYNTKDEGFVKKVLKGFSKDSLLEFFKDMGMEIWERDGYYYPYSGQASTVRDILILENERLGNRFLFKEHVSRISFKGQGYYIKTEHKEFFGRRLIVSAGGMAQRRLGSDGSLAGILASLEFEMAPFYPALVPLMWDCPYSKSLSGIRAKGTISLMVNGEPAAEAAGELQFTDYGISGIPAFQVSRYFSLYRDKKRKYERIEALIDFLPHVDKEELTDRLLLQMERFFKKGGTVENMARTLHGFGNDKLLRVLIRMHQAGRHASQATKLEKDTDIIKGGFPSLAKGLAQGLKEFSAEITGTRGFDFAQVCGGGVELSQLSPETMESVKHKGLYITGELLNVDGLCGGYNLQWAFSTGYLAGKAAGTSASD